MNPKRKQLISKAARKSNPTVVPVKKPEMPAWSSLDVDFLSNRALVQHYWHRNKVDGCPSTSSFFCHLWIWLTRYPIFVFVFHLYHEAQHAAVMCQVLARHVVEKADTGQTVLYITAYVYTIGWVTTFVVLAVIINRVRNTFWKPLQWENSA